MDSLRGDDSGGPRGRDDFLVYWWDGKRWVRSADRILDFRSADGDRTVGYTPKSA